MRTQFFLLFITIGFTVSSNAEVQISVSGYGNDAVHISTKDNSLPKISVFTNEDTDINYISVDKGTEIITSTVGTTVIVNRKLTKEKAIRHYSKKINRYEEKILKYQNKINNYEDKIIEKPTKKEKYQNKINQYQDKINEYQEKILEAEKKLKEYQSKR